MRALILGWLLSVAVAAPQEEDEEKKTFDVFDDEPAEDDLPEGDAEDPPVEVEEPREAPEIEVPEVELPVVEVLEVEVPPPAEIEPIETATVGPTAVVIVIGDPEDASLAERIADAASKAVASSRDLSPKTMLSALDPGVDSARRDAVQLGRRTVDDALVAFEELDLEAAADGLERGVTTLGAYIGELPTDARDALSVGLFTLGVTALFDGDTDRTDAMFTGLVFLDPTFIADADRYPSNVLERFDAIRAAIERRPTGTLTIETNPPGASIYVDGLYRGSSPLTASNLVAGVHLVSARRIGSLATATLALVEGQSSTPVELELELAADTSRVDRLSSSLPRDRSGCDALRRIIGADLIVVLALHRRMSGTVVEGLVIGSSGETVIELSEVSIVDDPEIAGGSIASAIQDRETAARLALEVKPEATRLVEEWWFWTAIGGAALVVAVGATVGALAASDGPQRNTGVFGF